MSRQENISDGDKAMKNGDTLSLSCNSLSWESLGPSEKGTASRAQETLTRKGRHLGSIHKVLPEVKIFLNCFVPPS